MSVEEEIVIVISRILKSDGKALISVWSKWQDKYRNYFIKKYLLNKSIREFGDIFIYWRKNGINVPRFYHLYSKIEFLNDINKSGLKLLSIEGVKLNSNKYIDNYFAVVVIFYLYKVFYGIIFLFLYS